MKRFISGFLISLIFFMQIPDLSYAAVSTASNAQLNTDDIQIVGDDLIATSSNADLDVQIEELLDYANIPMLMSDGGDPDIPDYMVPYASVYTSENKYYTTVRGQYVEMVNPSRAYYTFPARPYGQTYRDIFYKVPKAQLPKPGTYGVTWSMMQGNIGFDVPTNARVLIWAGGKNVTSVQTSAVATVSQNDSGNMYCTGNVTIGYDTTSVALQIWLSPYNSQLDISCPITEPWNFTLKSQGGGTAVSADVSSGNSSASDVIAQHTASMSDTLKEIVQTISNQLAALWDQMFNLMHLPQLANDDKNTDRIIEKLGEDLTVQIENQDDNTETIINGYDSSEFDQGNDKLNDSLDSYDQAEADIFENIRGYIDDFEIPAFSDNDSGVLSALSFCSDYLQKLFVNIGAFNIPITVSLVMIFVLMLLGYYRVRSNG